MYIVTNNIFYSRGVIPIIKNKKSQIFNFSAQQLNNFMK